VTAAIAGAKIAPAMAAIAWVAVMRANPSMNGRATELMVTATAATTMIARRLRARSISAPAGACAISPTIPAIVITEPTVASSQPWLGPRTAIR
jgi:hypothetical protein